MGIFNFHKRRDNFLLEQLEKRLKTLEEQGEEPQKKLYAVIESFQREQCSQNKVITAFLNSFNDNESKRISLEEKRLDAELKKLESLDRCMNADPAQNNISETEKLKAAYALNLCMVSLSQIVDYNDINILKMEYESILNNLNLENIVKDEALLDALKKILDTCHFYILHEKEKEMLKKRQASRLKNALGNALNGKGGIIALFGSPNPWAIAATAAVMVGSACISYKTERNKALLENEQEEWELQRSALDQLHSLRVTLFETAWRLATVYQFGDNLRLTEKQITVFNDILSDPIPLNRFERLDVISDHFEGYPLFWYYKGRAALEAAGEVFEREKKTTELYFNLRKKAALALQIFRDKYSNVHLLREDVVAASAYLDEAELLIGDGASVDQSTLVLVKNNLDSAVKLANMDFDILQSAVFRYLQIEDCRKAAGLSREKDFYDKVIRILRILINENHNTSINSRILCRVLKDAGDCSSYSYLQLKNQIMEKYPHMPDYYLLTENGDPENSFFSKVLPRETFSYLVKEYYLKKFLPVIFPVYDAWNLTLKNGSTAPLYGLKDEKNNYQNIFLKIVNGVMQECEDFLNQGKQKKTVLSGFNMYCCAEVIRETSHTLDVFLDLSVKHKFLFFGSSAIEISKDSDTGCYSELKEAFQKMVRQFIRMSSLLGENTASEIYRKSDSPEMENAILNYAEEISEHIYYDPLLRRFKHKFTENDFEFEPYQTNLTISEFEKQMDVLIFKRAAVTIMLSKDKNKKNLPECLKKFAELCEKYHIFCIEKNSSAALAGSNLYDPVNDGMQKFRQKYSDCLVEISEDSCFLRFL